MAMLAPMAGYTDDAFRRLCLDYGADLVVTELISSERINKTDMTFRKQEKFSIQLFGPSPESLYNAAKKVKAKCDIVDFNFGCPSRNIISQGSGAAWLNKLDDMRRLFEMMDFDFTIKIRAGFNGLKYRDVIRIANDFPRIRWITLHARTVEQGYSGEANWDWIRDAVDISIRPIVGNGDVKSAKDHNKLISIGCMDTMIGRASRGNPFIFEEIRYGKSNRDMRRAVEKYISYAEELGIRFSYVKNNVMHFFHSKKVRQEIMRIKEMGSLKDLIRAYSTLLEG